jgi:hypothetical protein
MMKIGDPGQQGLQSALGMNRQRVYCLGRHVVDGIPEVPGPILGSDRTVRSVSVRLAASSSALKIRSSAYSTLQVLRGCGWDSMS